MFKGVLPTAAVSGFILYDKWVSSQICLCSWYITQSHDIVIILSASRILFPKKFGKGERYLLYTIRGKLETLIFGNLVF